MYIVTSRWHVTSMEAFKKSAAIADQWFKDKDVDTSTLVIATGDMVEAENYQQEVVHYRSL